MRKLLLTTSPLDRLVIEIQNLKEEWNPRILTQEKMEEIKNSIEYLTKEEYFDEEIEIFTSSGSSSKYMKNIIKSADLNRWKNLSRISMIGGIIFEPTSKSLQGWMLVSPKKIAFITQLDMGWVRSNKKGYDSIQLLDEACKGKKIRWKGDSSMPIFYINFSSKNFRVEKVKEFIEDLKSVLSDIKIVKICD